MDRSNILSILLIVTCCIQYVYGLSEFPMDDMFAPLSIISVNDSLLNCPHVHCDWVEELGPPPDWLPPPPPLPPYLKQLLTENQSLDSKSDDCNFCHIFSNPQDSELVISRSDESQSDSWFSFLVPSILGFTLFGVVIVYVLMRCRRWKLFPPSTCGGDSCPIFPENILGEHKANPTPCSPADACVSPVVNEKSPQSIITSCPTKVIPGTYWRRPGSTLTRNNLGSSLMNPRATELDGSSGAPVDAESCTSSPVYAELDAAGVDISHSQIPASLLIGPPSQLLSPYVVHTYSEVADAMRMAALGSSTALLPDASYDNVAYLPSSNSDCHYQGRSLRRQQRAAQISQLGSTTPLLSNQHHQGIPSSLTYLSSGRMHKKPRPHYVHTTSRANSRNSLTPEIGQARSISSHRSDGLYTDLPVHSPSLTTFRVPYALNFREPKRPLPPVPGVRL